jgi:RNA polymerase sigma factor (sigma-70 family)
MHGSSGPGAEDIKSGLQWLADNYDNVMQVARQSCRKRYDLVDDLYGEAVDRVGNITACYIPELGNRDAHMMTNLRWYFYKWMNKNAGRVSKHEQIVDYLDELCIEHILPDLDGKNMVQIVVDRLDEYNKTLLLLHYAQGMSYQEIGEHLDVSKGTARLHCINALRLAREFAGVHGSA